MEIRDITDEVVTEEKAKTQDSTNTYQSGYQEGYRRGFSEGFNAGKIAYLRSKFKSAQQRVK